MSTFSFGSPFKPPNIPSQMTMLSTLRMFEQCSTKSQTKSAASPSPLRTTTGLGKKLPDGVRDGMPIHPTDRILAAMRTLLNDEGPKAITFRRVSETSGLSVGTVAYYFGSRDGLFEAALDSWHDVVSGYVRAMVTPDAAKAKAAAANAVDALVRRALNSRPTIRLRTMAWMLNWRLPTERRREVSHNLNSISALPWATHWPVADRRVLSLAMTFAVQRFACLDDDELLDFTGAATVEEAHKTVQRVIQRLLDDLSE